MLRISHVVMGSVEHSTLIAFDERVLFGFNTPGYYLVCVCVCCIVCVCDCVMVIHEPVCI